MRSSDFELLSTKRWRKVLPQLKSLLEGAKLMPALFMHLETIDVNARFRF